MQVPFKNFLYSFLFAMTAFSAGLKAQSFQHPGILHSQEDLDRMKQAVLAKQEPVYSGYKIFLENPASHYTYKMQGPMVSVGRNPTIGQGTYDSDANAAHQNAVMWAITGEKAYADKAIEIINAWSATLKSITGRDAVLMAGLGPFKMVNAAEILRYTHSGWKEEDIKKTETHFKTVIYPVIKNFALFANGNWDAAAIKTVMAIGVFCNDRAIFERGLQYYVNGAGNGRLSHYVINNNGQIQESGRDQGHTQLGIAMLAECSAIAWNQGLDLYSYDDNLLLKGFEYTAKYNLGNEVPFSPTIDHTGKYVHKVISTIDRGRLRAIYEQVYNHYVNTMGLPAPYTRQAAEKVRPEGPGKPGADHPGYGTLYYTVASGTSVAAQNAIPAPPGGLIATGSPKSVLITWIKSTGATDYTVKRAEKAGGPYIVVAKNILKETYTDPGVKKSTVYFYTVTARNKHGESKNAFEAAVSAGLPAPWKQEDIGNPSIPGAALYNGAQFELSGSGFGTDSINDELSFTNAPLNGDGVITARFVPQVSSQLSQPGLTIRAGAGQHAAQVSLLFFPGKSGQIEAPDWQVRMLVRKEQEGKTRLISKVSNFSGSAVTYGRLTGYYWLRLERKGQTVTGFVSPDGNGWSKVGAAIVSFKKNIPAGMVVSSGFKNISTTVHFDHVSLSAFK